MTSQNWPHSIEWFHHHHRTTGGAEDRTPKNGDFSRETAVSYGDTWYCCADVNVCFQRRRRGDRRHDPDHYSEGVFCLQAKKPLPSGSYERRVPKIKLKPFFCTRDVCFSVWFNIVIGHLRWPYSTHTAPMPVLTGSVHAHILTKPSRAGFAVIRLGLELIEPGAETCVYQAKSCSSADQPVRKIIDRLGINMTMKTFFTFFACSLVNKQKQRIITPNYSQIIHAHMSCTYYCCTCYPAGVCQSITISCKYPCYTAVAGRDSKCEDMTQPSLLIYGMYIHSDWVWVFSQVPTIWMINSYHK